MNKTTRKLVMKNLQRKAESLGFTLVNNSNTEVVS